MRDGVWGVSVCVCVCELLFVYLWVMVASDEQMRISGLTEAVLTQQ